MKLKDSPAVKVKVPSHNQLKDSANDVRVQREVGSVHSGANERHDSSVQPEADTKHGAQANRERKSVSEVTEGTHVHAGGDPEGNRVDYVKSEYARNESKVRGDSDRKPFREVLKKAKSQ